MMGAEATVEGLEDRVTRLEKKRSAQRLRTGVITGGLGAGWWAAAYVEWAYHWSPLQIGVSLGAAIFITFLFAGAMSE